MAKRTDGSKHRAVWLRLFDRLLLRGPFEGRSARSYLDERRAFGDLDDRLLDELAPQLAAPACRVLDLGCGPGTFADRVRARFPAALVVPVDPSRAFARPGVVRANGEALPLADRSIDVAVCLSSIRHVRDRRATLAELRRVVRGTLVVVELDPAAAAGKVTAHAAVFSSAILRRAFGPLVVRTAPPADGIAALAREVGFRLAELRSDPQQPVYVMMLH